MLREIWSRDSLCVTNMIDLPHMEMERKSKYDATRDRTRRSRNYQGANQS
jgi:hypothetical protein